MKNKKFKLYLFAVVFIIGLLYLLFNEQGLIKYLQLKSEINSLNEKIAKVDTLNKNLSQEIDSLRNKVPAKIEKVAREKYDMIRKGEKSIEVIEK